MNNIYCFICKKEIIRNTNNKILNPCQHFKNEDDEYIENFLKGFGSK